MTNKTFEDYVGIVFGMIITGLIMNAIAMCICVATLKMTDITSIKMISFIVGAICSALTFILMKDN